MISRKRYNLDTNMNGGVRAYVVTGLYDKYLPMDIYPLYLLKAILAGDIDTILQQKDEIFSILRGLRKQNP